MRCIQYILVQYFIAFSTGKILDHSSHNPIYAYVYQVVHEGNHGIQRVGRDDAHVQGIGDDYRIYIERERSKLAAVEPCDQCGKTSNRKDNLWRHLQHCAGHRPPPPQLPPPQQQQQHTTAPSPAVISTRHWEVQYRYAGDSISTTYQPPSTSYVHQ